MTRRTHRISSRVRGRRLMGGGLWVLAIAVVISVVGPLTAAGSADSDSVPGPCEDRYVAPTPVAVAVTGVPVVVTSTANDYFVLYATIPAGSDTTREVPVSVTRGEDGTTTLTDRLQPLSKDKYRVEKYQVAKPGDLDGDCVDDITELDGMGAYHPLNPAKKIDIGEGSVAVDSEETFKTLAYKGRAPYNFIKFMIFDLDGGNPYVYFINTNKYLAHDTFADKWHNPRRPGSTIVYGEMEYSPNVVASDGSLGVYHFTLLRGWTYWQAHHVNELLAATMPVLENNLAYRPRIKPLVNSLEAQHSDDRLVILEDEDLHPDVAFVPLNQAEGYGLLRLMEDGDEPRPIDIAIYKSLPNDLPRVAGTITTIPQTPLSHVNLRAIQNSVPNAFIRDILKDETLKALIGKHVYFAVTGEGYTLREATKKEVDDHHAAARPTETQTPERDLTVTKIAALADVSFDDWDAFGVKAANMAELSKLSLPAGTVPTGFAVPFYFYDEFMKNAGLAEETLFGKKKWPAADKFTLPAGTKLSAVVTQMLAHPRFQADYDVQEEMLDDLRDAIKDADSPDWIIKALEAMHAKYPDGQSLRYRSSTNNEDLPAFNGAGLYDSKTQDSDETTDDGIDKSIKAVWASLWNFRAFLEREYYRVDHATTAMGVLVHPNYSDELANGVAVSTDPIRFLDGMYYVNTQVGEDLVTNPEPNSLPEELLLDDEGKPIVLSRSSLAKQGQLLMSGTQMLQLRNNLKTIHDRFKTLYKVEDGDDFAVEIEFKITAGNKLAIKQARPWVFAPPLTLTPEVAVPINTPTARSTKEGRTVVTLLAPLVPNAAARWSMSGPDKGAFLIWATPTRRDLFFYPQDYENPEDADGDNVYSIVLTATDPDSGEKTNIDFTMTVVNDPDDDSGDLPVVSIRPLSDIIEGGGAAFVVSADPAPAEMIAVNVKVGQDGRFLWTSGMMTAWVSTSGRATFASGTRDDDTEEPDGSVSATLRPGVGYTVSADEGTASVGVADNDGPPDPEVSVTAGSDVTEGGDAEFTVTATPAPTAPLSVSLTVGQEGAFGVSTGTQTVTIPTGGSATVTVGTTDDDADEPDGSAGVTVDAGDGYTVSSSQGSASVVVSDDDDPPLPVVSVAAGSGVTEGADAVFTVSATPAPAQPLSVDVTVTQDGDFGTSTGSQTVTVPTSGSATVTVSTSDDDADEPDGSVSVSVDAGSDYTVSSSQGSASVVVSDDDDPPVGCGSAAALAAEARGNHDGLANTAANRKERNDWWRAWIALSGTTGTYNTPLTAAEALVLESGDARWTPFRAALECLEVTLPPVVVPEISVTAGSGVTEGGDASFTVTASPAPTTSLSVRVTVSQNGDYGASTGSRMVTVGTGGTATVTVSTSDDSVDETDGSVTVKVNARSGYSVSSTAGSASVVVSDDDPPVLGCGDTDALGLEAKGNHDGLPNIASNRKERNDWWRAWIALSGVTGTFNTPLSAAEANVLESGDLRWSRFRVALECLEGTPPPVTPVVSVTAGSGITEGADASFTVTASPAPTTPLSVSVTVSQSGDYGATTGSRTVTVGTGGTATVTVSTTDDSADETDGSVSVTVASGSRYTISGSQSSATVSVADNDDPPPNTVVSVTGGSGVTEGADALFTVSAIPAPAQPLSVSVTVTQSGDFGATTGSQTVTVPTSGSATVTVSTSDDSTDETDGSVSVTVNAGSGYTVSSSQGSASVDVADNDDPPPTPVVSVTGGSGVTEGGDASFTVTANPAPSAPLSVKVTVSQVGDYATSTGSRTVTVPTSGTATFVVSTTDDSTDETDGSVTVTVNAHSGYTVSSSQGTATVAVADDDVPLPVTPEVSVTAGAGIVEGGDVSFTVTANPVPVSPLSMSVTVTQSGDFGVSTGTRTVTVPISGTATVTVSTSDDSTYEPDGSVTVTVNGRDGYTVSATQGSASVNVADNDDPPPTDLPVVSVADGSVVEGEFGFLSLLEFQVTLSEPSEQDVTVRFRIRSGTAVNGLDYWGSWGQVTIWAGWTRATTGVNVRDDHIRERDETLVIELTDAEGAVIADNATATGTIIDND